MNRELFKMIEAISECQLLALALAMNAACVDSCSTAVEPHTLELNRDAAHLRQKLQMLVDVQKKAIDREKGS